MAEIVDFPKRDKSEEVMKQIRQSTIDGFCSTLMAAGWGTGRSQGTAVILWAECTGFLRGALSAGEPLPVALSRMSEFGIARVRQEIGLPPSP